MTICSFCSVKSKKITKFLDKTIDFFVDKCYKKSVAYFYIILNIEVKKEEVIYMATRIEEVDYNGFPRIAKAMREDAIKLNKEVTTAYSTVGVMQKSWYGPRYDELVKIFNKMIPNFESILKLTVTDFPYTLELIANNYSNVDKGRKVTTAEKTSIQKIQKISLSGKTTFRFMETNVKTHQTEINKNFDKILSYINSIEANYKKLNWKSAASKEFEMKFNRLKKDISTSVSDTKKQFKKLMDQTVEDIRRSEKANTVSQ